ncbi:MAG: CrtD protein [Methylibium sp. NZG]|nr:MAG: CrtD protein [Methylibium sp. NZG]
MEGRPVSRAHRVVVIGAGIGGLVAALQLACRGLDVTLIERAATPGGKMRRVLAGGALVDAGPTVFTMRWVLEQIFASAGASLAERLKLTPLDVLARHAWGPDHHLDLFADAARSTDAIAQFAGPDEARRFTAFCAQARKVYDTLEGPYIRSERPTLLRMATDLGPRGLSVLAGLGPFATLWRSLARRFRDPRLQQLFGRYATYCGSSPFAAPATLMLVAQVEMDGVWAVQGGMLAVAQALADLAQQRGATLRYGAHCEEVLVQGGRACGVRLAGGETLAADSVVFNGDVAALSSGLLGGGVARATRAVAPESRSLSAMTWAIHARTSGFPLVRHNVFFCADYAAEFSDIFQHRRLPRQGTVYVCAQDRDDSGNAPAAGGRASTADGANTNANATADASAPHAERLLCLVNAPACGDATDGGAFDPSEIESCEQTHFALLRHCGLTIDRTADNTRLTTPADFNRLFPATGGALYGQASRGWMDSFRRPSSTSRLPGLYLAGGSVHPGPGVPMAALSGQLAAETLMAHLDSTSRSRRVRISGGMSMRSATTGNTR